MRPTSRDGFGVHPLYRDGQGRLFHRIDEAGPTTLLPEAVAAWREGTFTARTKLVAELTPLPLGPTHPRTLGDLAGALDRAVDALAGAEREVHCLLSGGLDSAAIVDALHRTGRKVVAHALCDLAVDEAELSRARGLTRRLGVELIEHTIADAELPEFFAGAVRAAERPIFNARGVSLALFMKKLGLRRAFSGIGADEALDSARANTIEAVFEPKTLPPTVWAARSFGLELLLPYLEGEVLRCSIATADKQHLRHAFTERLGRELCFAPKSPRMARSIFESAARGRWEEVLGRRLESSYDADVLTEASFHVLERHFANAPWPESSS